MKNKNLNSETVRMINDLQGYIVDLLDLESNIEVVWKLEKLHNDNILLKGSEFIRKSIK